MIDSTVMITLVAMIVAGVANIEKARIELNKSLFIFRPSRVTKIAFQVIIVCDTAHRTFYGTNTTF